MATISRLLTIIGLFCKKAPYKRDLYSAKSPTKETSVFEFSVCYQFLFLLYIYECLRAQLLIQTTKLPPPLPIKHPRLSFFFFLPFFLVCADRICLRLCACSNMCVCIQICVCVFQYVCVRSNMCVCKCVK